MLDRMDYGGQIREKRDWITGVRRSAGNLSGPSSMRASGVRCWGLGGQMEMSDSSGTRLGEWGGFGVGRGNMTGPWGIASSSDGVWAADWFGCTVQKFRVESARGYWEKTLWSPL
jgi:hypothetical protein